MKSRNNYPPSCSSPGVRLVHIAEPQLTFGYGQKLTDPRDGITLFGPYTRDKLSGQLSVGIIGPERSRNFLKKWLREVHRPIAGDGEIARPFFPGVEAAYGVSINFSNLPEIDVPENEISKYLRYKDGHQRVHNLSNLYVDALMRYQKQEDVPVNMWFVVIPDEVYKYGRPKSRIPSAEDNIGVSLNRAGRQPGRMFLFGEMNKLKDAYDFEINFHNQLKAKLLKDKIITQVVRSSTIAYNEIWTDQKKIADQKRFDTAKAWNIVTTLYYKAGGLPWRLGDVRPGVCYLGLVFKKLHQDEADRNACCAAQMFLDSGDGVVFRGNVGPWYNPDTKEFHIRTTDAQELLRQSLASFKEKIPEALHPSEIFIHARTAFDDEEWGGFTVAAEGKSKLVGVRIRENYSVKLYRDYNYSVPRGTCMIYSKDRAYLFTKGYIPRLRTQLGLETPNPLEIHVTRGYPDILTVCKDILALTKLNYNSCLFGDGLPVTLRFADMIGEVLTSGRNVEGGVLPFKHYL